MAGRTASGRSLDLAAITTVVLGATAVGAGSQVVTDRIGGAVAHPAAAAILWVIGTMAIGATSVTPRAAALAGAITGAIAAASYHAAVGWFAGTASERPDLARWVALATLVGTLAGTQGHRLAESRRRSRPRRISARRAGRPRTPASRRGR